MRHLSGRRIVTWAALALVAFALAACGGRVNKELLAQASNIPASFDVTLIADKDNQFDYDPNGGTNGAPLTEEDLDSDRLPVKLRPHRAKLFGLTIDPVRLQQIRQERRPNSRYAQLDTCKREVAAAEAMLRNEGIQTLSTTHASIEEIASRVFEVLGLNREMF